MMNPYTERPCHDGANQNKDISKAPFTIHAGNGPLWGGMTDTGMTSQPLEETKTNELLAPGDTIEPGFGSQRGSNDQYHPNGSFNAHAYSVYSSEKKFETSADEHATYSAMASENMMKTSKSTSDPSSANHTSPSLSNKVKSKSSHNVIEQRYRNKINEKFSALQYSVPTLRALLDDTSKEALRSDLKETESDSSSDSDDNASDLEGLEPATKLNKGTILAKTVEYIKFLEDNNKVLTIEHEQLLARAKFLGLRPNE